MKELQHFNSEINWLPVSVSEQAYAFAHHHRCQTRNGLNPVNTIGIERLIPGVDYAESMQWLSRRLPTHGHMVVVFGNVDCFTCLPQFLAENWDDIFLPARDDAIVFSKLDPFIMLHAHEDEIEVGQRMS